MQLTFFLFFFFFNDTATTEIYTLSLHDALPIYPLRLPLRQARRAADRRHLRQGIQADQVDPLPLGHRIQVRDAHQGRGPRHGRSGLILVIGNKNYSSWSMRPWVLLRQAQIPFEEVQLKFDDGGRPQGIERYSPTRKVPVLVIDGEPVWDSLAI